MSNCCEDGNKYCYEKIYYCIYHLKNILIIDIKNELGEFIGSYDWYGINGYGFNRITEYITENNLTEELKDVLDEVNEIIKSISKLNEIYDKYSDKNLSLKCKISNQFKKCSKCHNDINKNNWYEDKYHNENYNWKKIYCKGCANLCVICNRVIPEHRYCVYCYDTHEKIISRTLIDRKKELGLVCDDCENLGGICNDCKTGETINRLHTLRKI